MRHTGARAEKQLQLPQPQDKDGIHRRPSHTRRIIRMRSIGAASASRMPVSSVFNSVKGGRRSKTWVLPISFRANHTREPFGGDGNIAAEWARLRDLSDDLSVGDGYNVGLWRERRADKPGQAAASVSQPVEFTMNSSRVWQTIAAGTRPCADALISALHA
jgi:hypothetical protein